MDTKLSVNLNKVALLRNQRDLSYPDVLEIARIVIEAGAHGITVHPRPDERHVRRSDVTALGDFIEAEHEDGIELNVEGYPSEDFLSLVLRVRPTQVTLVPDAPEQRTSDHGWDLRKDAARLEPTVAELAAAGIRVSLFVDPDESIVRLAKGTGAHRIELYTEPYARAHEAGAYEAKLEEYAAAADAGLECKLGINAGHDLNLDNLPPFKARIPMIAEVSIGHAITADALKLGFSAAVRAYLAAIA